MEDTPNVKKVKKPIVKRPPRTLKERAFVKEYIANGGVATTAALKVYDVQKSKNPYMTAHSIAGENLQKLAMPDLLDKLGLTDEALIERLNQGLYHSKGVWGTKDDFIEYEDTAKMHKFLETAYKLKGYLKNETKVGVAVANGSQVTIVNYGDQDNPTV